MNNKEDNVSPYMRPLVEAKVYEAEPLIRIENNFVDIKEETHHIHWSKNPYALST